MGGVRRTPPFRRLLRLGVGPPPTERDVDDELALHLELSVERLRAQGLGPDEARAEALRRFGDVGRYRDTCVDISRKREAAMRRARTWEALAQDVRYGVRGLLRAPGFALVAVLTLALGIGANTAIFSVVRGVLLKDLAHPEPDRLVRLFAANAQEGLQRGAITWPDLQDWRARTRALASAGGYFYSEGMSGDDLLGEGEPERIPTADVSEGFFETLRTPPLLGRALQAEDHRDGAAPVVVLSHGLWQRKFGGARDIVGRGVNLSGTPYTVVGVMPARFDFPSPNVQAWTSLSQVPQDSMPWKERFMRGFGAVGRLAPGATPEAVAVELSGVARALASEHPNTNKGWEAVTVVPLRDALVGGVKPVLLVLLGAVAFILLIACSNLASLMLARSTVREQELAVRAALGAGPGRLVRQLLTESAVLALAGAALGLGVAHLGARGLLRLAADKLPRAGDVALDGPVLAFALGAALLTAVLFGLAPALRACSPSLQGLIKSAGPGRAGPAGGRMRAGLVVVEVALAVVLTAGAGLAARSLGFLLSTDPGLDPRGVVVVRYSATEAGRGEEPLHAYHQRILEAVRAVPGVESAAGSKVLPLPSGSTPEAYPIAAPGQAVASMAELPRIATMFVSTDFLRTLRIPLRAGRDFTSADSNEVVETAGRAALVNEAYARKFLTGDPVGQVLRLGGENPLNVVGVVGDTRQEGLAEPAPPMVYLHSPQIPRSMVHLLVRGKGDLAGLAQGVRRAVQSVNPSQTVSRITTLEEVRGEDVATPRLLAVLLGLFALLGLALGAVGLYGVVAYAVTQRQREFGVRLALGARPRDVLRMVLRQGVVLAGTGVGLGVLGALVLARLMGSVLHGVRPHDPATLGLTAVLLLGVALLASWLPARRATRVDPVVSLRAE